MRKYVDETSLPEVLDNSFSGYSLFGSYIVVFNSGNYTTVYLSLSMGYIEDGKAVDLNFKNLALYQLT